MIDDSFAFPIRISIHAGHLDRSIAGIIDCPRQRLLQFLRSFGALPIGGGSRVLDDRLALTNMGQTSNQNQSYCIHLVPPLLHQLGTVMTVLLPAIDFNLVNNCASRKAADYLIGSGLIPVCSHRLPRGNGIVRQIGLAVLFG